VLSNSINHVGRRRCGAQASYALGYNLAIEYLADYEKTWMLDSFRALDARVLAPAGRPLREWLFLEVRVGTEGAGQLSCTEGAGQLSCTARTCAWGVYGSGQGHFCSFRRKARGKCVREPLALCACTMTGKACRQVLTAFACSGALTGPLNVCVGRAG